MSVWFLNKLFSIDTVSDSKQSTHVLGDLQNFLIRLGTSVCLKNTKAVSTQLENDANARVYSQQFK